MNEFESQKHYENEYEDEQPEVLDPTVEFEAQPEISKCSIVEKRVPKERKIKADEAVLRVLAEHLDMADPEGEVGLVFIEMTDSEEGQRSKCRGLDHALDVALDGQPLIITGWQTEVSYSADPRWHAVMAYPNVTFKRLPFSLTEIPGMVDEAKNGEKRPFDRLAIELTKVDRSVNAIASLEHNLKRAMEGGEETMKEWEKKAREIFGDEMSINDIVRRVYQNDQESVSGLLDGEEFEDLCVDIEGTLIKDGEIDMKLIERMKEESKTRPVTIWTGGDVKAYGKILREAGITFKIASKHWLAGAKVAKAIDDLPEEKFKRMYDVEIGEYIKV